MYRFTYRSPIVVILLSLITCNIYFIYWLYTTSNEINDALGRKEINTTLLIVFMILSYICFPFALYILYVMYQINSAMEELGQRSGIRTQSSFILWLILSLFFGIGSYVMMYQVQADTNALSGPGYGNPNMNQGQFYQGPNVNQSQPFNQYNNGNMNQSGAENNPGNDQNTNNGQQ